jgi:hypothetical protein
LSDDARADDADADDDEATNNDGADPNGAPTKHLNDLVDQLKKEQTTMDLMTIAKQHGVRAVCKHIVEHGISGVSEHEVTAMLTKAAQRSYPDVRPDQAFAKAYSAQTPDGELMRRAVETVKQQQFLSKVATLTPRVTGGRAAMDIGNPRDVLDDIQKLVAEQRRQHPELSQAQAFARVYEDPANKDLASRERAQNRPTASW